MQDIPFASIKELSRQRAALFLTCILVYLGIYVAMGIAGDADPTDILHMDKLMLLALQGIASFFFFLFLPWLLLAFGIGERRTFTKEGITIGAGWLLMLIFSNMIFMSALIEWNISLDLPDGAFETWAQAKEAELKILTEYLVEFDGPLQFALSLVVMAILPALGEELLFRGLFQNLLARISGNVHLAIWVSALLFSAIHLQFYGFFPRMLLGALFGYVYVWSGNLTIPVLAHFFHNGLALCFAYAAGMSEIGFDESQMEKSAPWYIVLTFLALGIFAILKFKQSQRDGRLDDHI